ncbi:aldehyde dehydrogenase family protein [Paraburkholderia silvatlantica]|uniref:aldehyde dehydrogenase family protein n=1 Tax=Paraburkholderia silvatlantica TaxID=321895 RepID=UPI0037526DFD
MASRQSKQAESLAELDFGGFTHTIDGRAESGDREFDVIDPSHGIVFARCPDATREQLDRAVAAARRAFYEWSSLSWQERGAYLRQFADAVRAHADELARLLTKEQGKPLADAKWEIMLAAGALAQFSTKEVSGEVLRDTEQERVELHYRPMGVAGVISPWNMPIALMVLRMAPSLQTGSTVVGKPSPYTPLSSLKLGELARDALPPGVLNIVSGSDALGQWMTEHPGIDKVSFTGSMRTGKRVMVSSAGTLKRITLELGGNDAAIVLNDVDPQAVAERLFWGAFYNSGQVCMAIKRLYVHEQVYEPMVNALAKLARSVKMGDGLEADVRLGPLQNKMQYELVKEILRDTHAQPGVRIVAGGAALDRPGYFIAPTIVADINEGTRLVDEEQFGPVLPVLKFSDVNDAVRRANATRYGLGASVWSSDLAKAAHVAGRIEAGTVWINTHLVSDIDTPFGGWKESGIGRGNGDIGLKSCMESSVVRLSKAPI